MTLEDDCLLRVEAIYAGVSNIQGMENAPVTYDIGNHVKMEDLEGKGVND